MPGGVATPSGGPLGLGRQSSRSAGVRPFPVDLRSVRPWLSVIELWVFTLAEDGHERLSVVVTDPVAFAARAVPELELVLVLVAVLVAGLVSVWVGESTSHGKSPADR